MEPVTALGIFAGILTTSSFLPQVVKAWKSRHTKDVSLGMFVLLVIGFVLWLTYGVLTGDVPVILANIVSLALGLTMIVFKLRYG